MIECRLTGAYILLLRRSHYLSITPAQSALGRVLSVAIVLTRVTYHIVIVLSKVVSSAEIKWTAKHPPSAGQPRPVFHQRISLLAREGEEEMEWR